MRDADRREIFACRWNDDINELADDCAAATPLAWTAWAQDRPAAVFGLSPVRPGVAAAWLFATDEFSMVAKAVTRFAKGVIQPGAHLAGLHRIEAHSIAGHGLAHQWMVKAFGAAKEADHPGFGRRGETFSTFAWVAPNVRSET